MTDDAILSLEGMEAIWAAAWESLDADNVVALFAEEAVMLTANRPLIRGRGEIRQAIAPLFEMKGLSTRMTPRRQEVAASGDFGYTYGDYETRFTDAAGRIAGHDGHYAAVWKKNAAGNWRIVLYSAHPTPAGLKKQDETP